MLIRLAAMGKPRSEVAKGGGVHSSNRLPALPHTLTLRGYSDNWPVMMAHSETIVRILRLVASLLPAKVKRLWAQGLLGDQPAKLPVLDRA